MPVETTQEDLRSVHQLTILPSSALTIISEEYQILLNQASSAARIL